MTAPLSSPSTPTTPHLLVATSPTASTNPPPRLSLNPPSAPMLVSQRYRPYSVTSPWLSPTPPSPGPRGAALPAWSPSPAGLPVPPNTPSPLPPSPQSSSLSSPRPRHHPTSMPLPLVPHSPRAAARQAALAARIPPSRYIPNSNVSIRNVPASKCTKAVTKCPMQHYLLQCDMV